MSTNPYIDLDPVFADPEPTSSRGRKPPAKTKPIHHKRRAYYRSNPVQFSEDVLGIHPWGKQRQILNAIANHRRIAV